MNDFGCNHKVASFFVNDTRMMTDTDASGGWEICSMVGAHRCIRGLFEIFADWMRILDAWIVGNWKFTVTCFY